MLTGNLNDDLVMDSTDDFDDLNDDVNDLENSKSKDSSSKSATGLNEDDKRKRRAIANSNERRRMQSINAGFQNLKSLIPHSNGEKLSKACILQRSADYMQFLSKEKDKLNYRLQIAIKLIETHGLLNELHKNVALDDPNPYQISPVKTECQKICTKRKSLSSISSILRSDESRQLIDSTNRPSVKSSEQEEAEKIKTRSSSIDQLIAAAAVTSSAPNSPASSTQPSSSETPKKNLNLNTIFEAIKHVEGKNVEQPDVNKPPKKRKYTTEDAVQAQSTSMCYIDLKQLNALCLNQNQMQPTQLAILTSNENKNSTDEQTKKNDKIIGLLVTSS